MAGRRRVAVDDPSAWVFNRMVDAYGARPAYPAALVDELKALLPPAGHVVDVGAGIGHLALPLAEHGARVSAIEPAAGMLQKLHETAARRALRIECLHAAAESMPVPSASADLVVIADAVHFLDAALTGAEVGRILRPGGALAVVTCQLGQTPFMRALVALMEQGAPRRPRPIAKNITQLAALAGVDLNQQLTLHDQAEVDHDVLERILRSISFIGPAMNEQRFSAFRTAVRQLAHAPHWARSFVLQMGRRRSR